MAKTNRPVLSEVRAVFDSLVKQHGLKSSFHRVLAWQISTALSKGELAEATRALALLPAPRGVVDHSPTVSASSARKKLTDLPSTTFQRKAAMTGSQKSPPNVRASRQILLP